MTTLRPILCKDLFKMFNITSHPFLDVYRMSFYVNYMIRWPEFFQVAESPNGQIVGYIFGKVEGNCETWHGHISSLAVCQEYRHLGLATRLMRYIEDLSEERCAYYLDLFVRKSNISAIRLYEKMGFIIYRSILKYYKTFKEEDGLDMRKALSSDFDRKSIIPPAVQHIKSKDLRHN